MIYFKILLLTILPFLINAQNLTKEHFAAYGNITSVGLTSPYTFTITGFKGNNRPYLNDAYIASDVLVGDKIFIACDQYVVASITSTAPNFTGTMTKIDVNTPDPTNFQRVAIIREYTSSNGLITYALPSIGDGNAASIGGIDIALGACIKAHYMTRDSLALTNALVANKDITRYTGNGIPLFTPLAGEPVKAIGLSAPFPEYNWNGTTWIPAGGVIAIGDSSVMSLEKTGAGIYKASLNMLDAPVLTAIDLPVDRTVIVTNKVGVIEKTTQEVFLQPAVEIFTNSVYPLIPPVKIGNEVFVINGVDTTVAKWNGTKWENDFVYGIGTPQVETSIFSNRKAIWKRNLSRLTPSPYFKDYVVRGDRWEAESVITPRDFGAKGDSITDDTYAFKQMFEFLNYAGGEDKNVRKVFIPNGKYRLTTRVTDSYGYSLDKDIEVTGETGTLIINECALSVEPFQFITKLDFEGTVTSPIERSTNYFLSTGIKPNVGSTCVIYSTTEFAETAWNYKIEDNGVVVRTSGDSIFLNKNFNFPYEGLNTKVFYYPPVKVVFKNIDFKSYKQFGRNNLLVQNTQSSEIESINCINTDKDVTTNITVGIRCSRNININIKNITIKNSFYAIGIDGGYNANLDNITTINCEGGIIAPALFATKVTGTNLVGYASNLDAHPSFDITYKNVTMYDGKIKMEGWRQNIENVKCYNKDTIVHLFASYNFSSNAKYDYLWGENVNTMTDVIALSKNKKTEFAIQFDPMFANANMTIRNLTTNYLNIDKFGKNVSVEGGSLGLLKVRDSSSISNVQFNGNLTPSWANGFIEAFESPVIFSNIVTSNAAKYTLFSRATSLQNIKVLNSDIQGIYGIMPRGSSGQNEHIQFINCSLKNFGTKTLNKVSLINTRTDATVKAIEYGEHPNSPEWFTLQSDAYNKSGIEVVNTITGGSAIVKLKTGVIGASFNTFYDGTANFENTRPDVGRFLWWQTNGGVRQNPMTLYDNGNLSIGANQYNHRLTVQSNADPLKLIGLQQGTNADSLLSSNAGITKRLSIQEAVSGGYYQVPIISSNNVIATSAQTAFTFTVSGIDATTVHTSRIEVFRNGILQQVGIDYTLGTISATTIPITWIGSSVIAGDRYFAKIR